MASDIRVARTDVITGAVLALIAAGVQAFGAGKPWLELPVTATFTRPPQTPVRGSAQFTLAETSVPIAVVHLPSAVAVLLLFVAAATGRVSGLDPLLDGVVWGAVPAAFALAAPSQLARGVRQLPDVYDALGFGIRAYGVVVFPLVTVLLLGAAVSGRWR